MPDPKNILVLQPSWVGDAVMATPTLRALRGRFADARITYVMRRYLRPIYDGMPWADRLLTYRTGKAKTGSRDHAFRLGRLLRAGEFDLAVLLPNSFKSALTCKVAGIPRIVGYERDGRGMLLTDKLLPLRNNDGFVPTPIVGYYAALARFLGARDVDLKMELFVTDADRAEANAALTRANVDPTLDRPWRNDGKPPLVILNPGANYGAAKCWLPDYFAKLSDQLIDERGATVIVSSAPKEKQIVEDIRRAARRPFVDLAAAGIGLGGLKEVIRRADLMVTNDTGPRHIAAAMDLPVVTIFGPTHPAWTEIDFALERQVAVKVFCGPCQRKICPLDHRCMTRVTPERVYDTSLDLLAAGRTAQTTSS